MKVCFWPDFRCISTYQKNLYDTFPNQWTTEPADIDSALSSAKGKLFERPESVVAFHLHWVDSLIIDGAGEFSPSLAWTFLQKVEEFMLYGGLFIWTVHEIYPHGCNISPALAKFHRDLASKAHLLHCHSASAKDRIAQQYRCKPNKIVTALHATFTVPQLDHDQCREELREYYSLSEKVVITMPGSIEPHKEPELFIATVQHLVDDGENVHAMLIEKISDHYGDEASVRATVTEDFQLLHRSLDEQSYWAHLMASDIVFLPYVDSYSADLVIQSLQTGARVVAPSALGISSWLSDDLDCRLYEYRAYSETEMLAVMRTAISDANAEIREDSLTERWKFANEFAQSLKPDVVYASLIKKLVSIFQSVTAPLDQALKSIESISTPVAVVCMDGTNDCYLGSAVSKGVELASDDVSLVLASNSEIKHRRVSIASDESCNACLLFFNANLGWAAALNRIYEALSRSSVECVVVVNADIEITRKTVFQIVDTLKFLEDHTVVSPLILTKTGTTVRHGGALISGDHYSGLRVLYQGEPYEGLKGLEPWKVDSVSIECFGTKIETIKDYGADLEEEAFRLGELFWPNGDENQFISLLVDPRMAVTMKRRSSAGTIPSPQCFYYGIRSSWAITKERQSAAKFLEQLSEQFYNPWINRIESIYGEMTASFYRTVAKAALQDAKSSITGSVGLPRFLSEDHEELDGVWYVDHGFLTVNFDFPDRLLSVVGEHLDVLVFNESGGLISQAKFNVQTRRLTIGSGGFFTDECYFELENKQNLSVMFPQVDIVVQCIFVHQALKTTNYVTQVDAHFCESDGYSIRGWLLDNGTPDLGFVGFAIIGDVRLMLNPDRELLRDVNGTLGLGDFARVGVVLTGPLPKCIHGGGQRIELFSEAGDKVWEGRLDISMPELTQLVDLDAYIAKRAGFTIASSVEGELNKKAFKLAKNKIARHSEEPKVSVVMPVYNRVTQLMDAINSVIQQTHGNVELLICDDGSSDGSWDLLTELQRYYSDTIRLIRNTANQGVSSARNNCLEIADGDYIAYLDSDCTWDRRYLTTMVGELISFGGTLKSAYSGQNICVNTQLVDGSQSKLYSFSRLTQFDLAELANANYIDLNVFVHSRSFLDCIGGGFDESLRRLVDWDLIFRMALVQEPVMVRSFMSKYNVGTAVNQITDMESLQENIPSSIVSWREARSH